MVQQALQYFYEDLITKDTIKGVVLIINNSGVIDSIANILLFYWY